MTKLMAQDITHTASIDIESGTSLWKDAYYRLKQNRLALLGLYIFVAVGLFSLIGPWFSPYTYDAQDLSLVSQPPSAEHWMGTDNLGRDVCTRIMYGGRISIGVGFAATLVSLVIGILYGTISGFAGGKTDTAMMRIVDILYALPFTVFVIILMVVFGRNIILLFVAIGAVEWLTMARIVRGQVLSLRKLEFIEAATALGLSRMRIILRHIIPSVLGPVIVYSTLTIPSAMLLEAVLSFLGLGVQPPMSSWGLLIKDGAEMMEVYPWLLFFPAFFFSITLFALNFLGDGLRDALDPQSADN